MADVSGITAVRPTANTRTDTVVYGATISAGQLVYLDSATSKYKLADANDTSATAEVVGLTLTPGVDSGYGIIATDGDVILVGSTLSVGEQLCVSATPGGIAPDADITTGYYLSQVGVATTTTTLSLNINATGITHA